MHVQCVFSQMGSGMFAHVALFPAPFHGLKLTCAERAMRACGLISLVAQSGDDPLSALSAHFAHPVLFIHQHDDRGPVFWQGLGHLRKSHDDDVVAGLQQARGGAVRLDDA